MKNETELMTLPGTNGWSVQGTSRDGGVAMPGTEEPRPLARIHSLLRGRYLLTMILALLLGGGAGVATYLMWKPRYQSVAQVRVAPIVPRILFRSEQNDVMPMYEGYIGSQMAMMGSERVLDRAMRKPQWKQWNRGMSDEAMREFQESAVIQRDRGAEVINIRFTDRTPDAAQAGAKSVLDAYMEIFGEEDIKRHELQLSVLENRRSILSGETKAFRERIFQIASKYGTDSLDGQYTFQMTEMQKIETALRQMQADSADQMVKVDHVTAAEEPKPAGAHVIAMRDRTMERFLGEKQSLELEVKELLFYRTDEHPLVIRARSRLANVQERIEAYQKDFNASTGLPAVADPVEDAMVRFQLLQARASRYRELFTSAQEETFELGRQNLEINRLREEVADSQTRLAETTARIEQLNVESIVSGRITIISPGDRSGLPVNVNQRVQLSALAAAGGVSAAFALMMLVGAANRRYRSVDQTRLGCSRTTVLGVVPEISTRLVNEESGRNAALSVHQIRSRLQLNGLGKRHPVLAITSATASEGKTSLTVALGVSLAASGNKTLLVDFDLLGQGLSALAVDRPLLGDLLMRDSSLMPKHLSKALRAATSKKTRLGDSLVDLGFVSRDVVEAAALKQTKMNRGLADVLAGHPLEECVIAHMPESLSILPVGNTDGHDLTALSPAKIATFLEKLKGDYDVILLDCGPVPASLDASLIIPHADAVLFVVSQGTREDAVERAFVHLDEIRASTAGIVFNRATWRDIQSYGSSTRPRQGRGRTSNAVVVPDSGADYAKAYGALAFATAIHQRRRGQSMPAIS